MVEGVMLNDRAARLAAGRLLAAWRAGAVDTLLLDFCGMLAVNSIGLVISMFLRVYRVMISSLPDQVRLRSPVRLNCTRLMLSQHLCASRPRRCCSCANRVPGGAQFPTVKEYHDDAGYHTLLLVNAVISLLQYYVTASAAYRMGRGKYFRDTRGR